MKALGLFGITIPEEYGGLGLDLLTYIGVVEELAYGWMSLSGIVNTHTIAAHLIVHHGTEEQKQRWLPRLATGELRGCLSLSEADAGQRHAQHRRAAPCATATSTSIDGTKMWVTNGERAGHRRARGAHRRRHLVLHRREGARADAVRRHHREPQHRQARLQGHRDRRDGLRRPPRPGRRAARRRGPRPRLHPRRARGRPHQHRGARRRRGARRVRRRARVRAGARARWASRSPSIRRSR